MCTPGASLAEPTGRRSFKTRHNGVWEPALPYTFSFLRRNFLRSGLLHFCCKIFIGRCEGWDLRSELPFAAAGVSGLTLYFLLENTALRYTLASNVGIIISAAPMFAALLLWLCRRGPRPRAVFFAGFAIALTGIALISLSGGESLELNPLGDLLTLGAALCWGAYGVCLEFASSSGLNQLQCTRKVFFWGLATLLPLLPILHPDYSLSRFSDPSMLFNILYLGLVASALCFVCWNKAMVLIGTVATNVYIYLTPVVTLIASALILGEPVRPQAIGAIFLILPGLWLSQRPTS